MPFLIIRQDITTMPTEAIVNAANTALRMGGGVCGAIFSAAGEENMKKACNALAPIKTGDSVITPGFRLPATYVIHAAGPIYQAEKGEENARLLYKTYASALSLAKEKGIESITFPLISSGIYGYPKKEALQVARCAITDFLKDHEMHVYLVIWKR